MSAWMRANLLTELYILYHKPWLQHHRCFLLCLPLHSQPIHVWQAHLQGFQKLPLYSSAISTTCWYTWLGKQGRPGEMAEPIIRGKFFGMSCQACLVEKQSNRNKYGAPEHFFPDDELKPKLKTQTRYKCLLESFSLLLAVIFISLRNCTETWELQSTRKKCPGRREDFLPPPANP